VKQRLNCWWKGISIHKEGINSPPTYEFRANFSAIWINLTNYSGTETHHKYTDYIGTEYEK
jgi:hypothetical protein